MKLVPCASIICSIKLTNNSTLKFRLKNQVYEC